MLKTSGREILNVNDVGNEQRELVTLFHPALSLGYLLIVPVNKPLALLSCSLLGFFWHVCFIVERERQDRRGHDVQQTPGIEPCSLLQSPDARSCTRRGCVRVLSRSLSVDRLKWVPLAGRCRGERNPSAMMLVRQTEETCDPSGPKQEAVPDFPARRLCLCSRRSVLTLNKAS